MSVVMIGQLLIKIFYDKIFKDRQLSVKIWPISAIVKQLASPDHPPSQLTTDLYEQLTVNI